MKIKLFGKKSEAVFDGWSLGHVFLYFFLTFLYLKQFSFERAFIILLILTYFWEILERAMEQSERPFFRRLFPEKECWHNRYFGDMLANTAGFLAGYFL